MRILSLFLSIFLASYALAQEQTTLRHFTPGSENYLYPSNSTQIVARFELETPINLKSLKIKCDGAKGSTATVDIYGHEGGTSFPQLEIPILPSMTLTKNISGEEWVSIDLPQTLTLSNSQFFVVLSNWSNGFRIYADNALRSASCQSSNGGDYYYGYLKNSNGGWSVAIKQAFAIEVLGTVDKISDSWFYDATEKLGIDPELSNATIAVADLNNDDYPEILVAGKLFWNDGGDSFYQEPDRFQFPGTPKANAFIDLDNDGDLDMIFMAVGKTSYAYENMGDLSFEERELKNIPDLSRINSLSVADLNEDGYPDIFVSQLWGTYPVPMPNYLFYNNGDFSFSDQTKRIYPNHRGDENYPSKTACDPGNQATWTPNQNRNRRSRGSEFVDFDNDGDLDLYVVNYFLEKDEFYENDGNGNFTDVISFKDIDRNRTGANHGTGVDWADFDADGDMDLLLPQFAHPAFSLQFDHRATTVYVNDNGNFTDLNPANEHIDPNSGIEFEETYAGAAWGDFNNDGLDDFYNTVYYGCRYVKMYQNIGNKTFENVSHYSGLSKVNTGQDAVWADLNNDGKLDLLTGESNRIRIWMNQAPDVGNYVKINLKPKSGNSKAIGAYILAKYDDKNKMIPVTAGQGQRMQHPYTLHLGLGSSTVIPSLEVHWNSGVVDVHKNLKSGLIYTLEEGKLIDNDGGASIEKVAPNPAETSFTVSVSNTLDQVKMLQFYNIHGQLVSEAPISPGSAQEVIWSTQNLASGLYFLRFGEDVKKVVIQ